MFLLVFLTVLESLEEADDDDDDDDGDESSISSLNAWPNRIVQPSSAEEASDWPLFCRTFPITSKACIAWTVGRHR